MQCARRCAQVIRTHSAECVRSAPSNRGRWSSTLQQATGARLPSLAAFGARFDIEKVKQKHVLFKEVFADDSAAPVGLWMEVFYRRPHIDLLPAVLIEALRSPGMLTDRQSLAGAVFLSEAFKTICPDTSSAFRVMDCYIAATEAEGLLGENSKDIAPERKAQAADLLDTILRGMWLADTPCLDLYLSRTVESWREVLLKAERPRDRDNEEWTAQDEAAMVDSIFPPEGERQRSHILRWPIPSLTLTSFESHLKDCPFPLYGATRYWFSYTHGLRKIATDPDPVKAARLQLLSPLVAQDLTRAMVDALWSYFYASGDAVGTVSRVMDVATPYREFMEEFGDAWVTQYDSKQAPPEDLADSPVALMKFETSRYALWSLLAHARRHTVVGEAFLDHMGQVNDTMILRDPFMTEGLLTAFGRARFELMRALRPSLQSLAIAATQDGIGSGRYPQAYQRLLGSTETQPGAKLLEAPTSAAHQSPATATTAVDSTSPGPQILATAAVPAAGLGDRDRRRITAALRSSRIAATRG